MRIRRTPLVVDLFSGCGGWSVAAQRLGIETLGVEKNASAVATQRAAGHRVLHADVTKVHDWFGPIDGLIASPPCTTFSVAGRGAGRQRMTELIGAVVALAAGDEHVALADWDDQLSTLVLEPMRYILRYRPRWVAMEQVSTVLPLWRAYAWCLEQSGYYCDTALLNAECYGVPQTRRRAILVARSDAPAMLPRPTHSRYYPRTPNKLDEGVLPWVSMAEALGAKHPDFDVISNYGTGGDATVRGHRQGCEPAATVTEKAGRNKIRLRMDRQANAIKWARPLDAPAATVKTGHSAPSEMAWFDEENERNVTVEEAAVLQSFPRDYPFQGTKGARFLGIGNAIPPLLAEAILRSVI